VGRENPLTPTLSPSEGAREKKALNANGGLKTIFANGWSRFKKLFRQGKRRRWGRILFAIAAALFILPMSFIHIVIFLYAMNDHRMDRFSSHVIKDSFGHTIHYYESQPTEAAWNIIFIHGTPGDAAAFRQQFLNPFPGANIIALDRPGFVGSKPDLRRPSLEDQANAIGALLTNIPPLKTILVGHSYGGPVALLAALKFTNQVAGAVLIGGSVDPAQEHIMWIQHVGDWPVLSWTLPRSLRQCNRELLTLRGDLIHLRTQLAALTVPVLMLHGMKDQLVPVANVEYLRNQLAAAGKTNLFDQLVFPDYDHFIPWEHPDAVESAIKKLITDIQQQPQKK
jgi:pimeloyl-ACP methyl ester carboxylesterase